MHMILIPKLQRTTQKPSTKCGHYSVSGFTKSTKLGIKLSALLGTPAIWIPLSFYMHIVFPHCNFIFWKSSWKWFGLDL